MTLSTQPVATPVNVAIIVKDGLVAEAVSNAQINLLVVNMDAKDNAQVNVQGYDDQGQGSEVVPEVNEAMLDAIIAQVRAQP